MASTNAKTELDAEITFKVNHARQVVDQVVLLRERVKRQEKAIESVIVERDLALECCEKQKLLIEQLRHPKVTPQHGAQQVRDQQFAVGSVGDQPATVQQNMIANIALTESTLDADKAQDVLLNNTRGRNFGRRVPGKTAIRVNSMRTALLRISGVDLSMSDDEDQVDRGMHGNLRHDAFDASEFQPLVDEQRLGVTIRRVVGKVLSSIGQAALRMCGKKGHSNLESGDLQTSR